MARTELTKTIKPGGYTGTGVKLNLQPGDATNGNKFKGNGNDLLVVRNTDTASHTVTIVSVDDPYGRQENISSYSIPAGETHIFGPFPTMGWLQSDGYIYTDCDGTTVEIGIVTL